MHDLMRVQEFHGLENLPCDFPNLIKSEILATFFDETLKTGVACAL
jgi:hypothetical protein